MVNFLKNLFGENWKTTLVGVGLFVFAGAKCLFAGGVFGECLSEAWNAAFLTGGAGLAAGAQASRF